MIGLVTVTLRTTALTPVLFGTPLTPRTVNDRISPADIAGGEVRVSTMRAGVTGLNLAPGDGSPGVYQPTTSTMRCVVPFEL